MAARPPLARPPRSAARRGAARDAEQTRLRVLEAAAAEFARYGLGGARVERMAAQAGVNVRMLYYYFSSKDALFLAVLERAYRMIREAEQRLELDQAEPEEAVRRLVRFTWEFQLTRPEFITLLNSENLHRGRHLAKSVLVEGLHAPLLETIGRVLARGARAGAFRDDVDPMQFYISIASLGYFYLSNRHTLSKIFGRDLLAPGSRKARLAHNIEVVLGFLRDGARAGRREGAGAART